MKIILTTLNAKYIHSSLALYSLKAFCRQPANEIVIKEYSVNNGVLNVLSDLYAQAPDIIGLACYIWNIEMTLELTALLRKVLPRVIIILGGPEVTYGGEEIMSKSPEIDFIIQGEGEESLNALLACLQTGQDPASIGGLLYRRREEIVQTGAPQIVADLNALPFAYDKNDFTALKDKIIYYESSRGCPFSCQYCLSSVTQGVRFLPVPRVLAELRLFIEQNVRQVKFVDRTFNARKEHYLPILQFLAEADCQTNFHFEIAADILDEETLAVLEKAPAGRFQLEIGVQSTNEQTLQAIRRTNNWQRIVDNVSALKAFGTIHLHLDLIAGLPYEGYSRFGKSFDDVFSLRPHMLQLGFLKLLKGSGIRSRAESDAYLWMDKAPYEILANQYMSYGEIRTLKILEEVLNQTYNSGRYRLITEWLIQKWGSAFAFFSDFAAYWEKRQLHTVSHSAKSIYQYYADYCTAKGFEEDGAYLQLIKFDALCADNGSIRPEFLLWDAAHWDELKSNFFRNESLVRKYIANYHFTNWRQIKKLYHIEFFEYDVTNCCEIIKQRTPILFIYDQHATIYKKLNMAEFFEEGVEPTRAL